MHHASDVIAGWLVGAAIGVLARRTEHEGTAAPRALMGLPRRAFLGSAAGLTAAALAGCVPRPEPSYPPQSGVPFEGEGVPLRGALRPDPSASAVLLWTRVHPERDRGDGCRVLAEVATDPGFGISSVVWSAEAVARPGSDHCVTLDAAGLQPATTYWYRFTHDSHVSRTGRTRTAPVGPTERLRLAAFSCQRYTQGWYTAHADLAGLAARTPTSTCCCPWVTTSTTRATRTVSTYPDATTRCRTR
ncbi:MAG: PhoD-like phosphatase N-terminal domain-containing protein [Microthrixaceae bacterium]